MENDQNDPLAGRWMISLNMDSPMAPTRSRIQPFFALKNAAVLLLDLSENVWYTKKWGKHNPSIGWLGFFFAVNIAVVQGTAILKQTQNNVVDISPHPIACPIKSPFLSL